jgi:chromosome segregation ATPase
MGACGGASLSKTVDLDKLKDMSRQAQIWIYDAENEIVVALDKLDEAKDVLAQVRKRIRHAEARLEAAEKRKNRTGVEMAEEWIKYLEALQRWAKARIEADRVGVVAAQAGVELAKAQVINREDLLAGKGFAVKDYQDQYDEWKKEFETERKRAANLRKTARELEGKWWALRRRFIAQTGDCDSGLWTD